MKFKSAVFTQASGSIGGITYSHNTGGMYVRARATPTNPNSTYQQDVRSYLASLAIAWATTVSDANRALWADYAANVPLVDRLGESRPIPALAMYCRCNVPRLQAGLARVDAGPTLFSLAQLTAPSVTVDAATDNVGVAFTNTDTWATAVGGALLVYASRPVSPAINFYKGPYRYAGKIAGAVSPPTSPEDIELPFTVVAGQQVFFRFVATNADGRLSADFRDGGIAA